MNHCATPISDMATVLRFHSGQQQRQSPRLQLRIFVGFWLLGLINNAAYVIMIAGANEIAASAVGLVYFAAIGPTILVKLTAPYWFHLVSYSVRFWVAALLMTASFCIVALSSNTTAQLLGVALVAVQGGLGEASALGLCSLHPNQLSLTAWSSGTGFAGIMGYAWVAVLHYMLQLSYRTTLLLATAMPGIWLAVFHSLMRLSSGPHSTSSNGSKDHGQYSPVPTTAAEDGTEALLRPDSSLSSSNSSSASSRTSRVTSPEVELSSPASSAPDIETHAQQQQQQQQQEPLRTQPHSSIQQEHSAVRRFSSKQTSQQQQQQHQDQQQWQDQPVVLHLSSSIVGYRAVSGDVEQQQQQHGAEAEVLRDKDIVLDPQHMSGLQTFKATCALWPYMVPLFVVYFAEYAMQSGTWTAVGFPVTSREARQLWYIYSNWLYQAGVCVSRSSGMLFQANRVVLWIMPLLQCLLLLFFSADAVLHVWWNWWLLTLCFVAGLLGGAVYVNSFTLMSREVDPALKEFSLSAACVADSIGIAAADVTAIFIQGCLFKLQGLQGAAFACGADRL